MMKRKEFEIKERKDSDAFYCPNNYKKMLDDRKCVGFTEFNCQSLGLFDCSIAKPGSWTGNCASSKQFCAESRKNTYLSYFTGALKVTAFALSFGSSVAITAAIAGIKTVIFNTSYI